MLSEGQRRLRAQIAANSRWSRTEDRRAAMQAASAGFLGRFLDEVDPNRQLPEAERTRRALSARKAHMQRLALRSSRVRSAEMNNSRQGTNPAAVQEEGRVSVQPPAA